VPKPDFSGTWRFDPARSDLEIRAPEASVFVIEHEDPFLRISRTHFADGKSDTFTLELTTDGREVAAERGDLKIRARAHWDGDTLVFDSRLARGGEEAANLVRYDLAADRRSLVAEERFRSASLSYDNTWVLGRE
jgi:hypothetical protein